MVRYENKTTTNDKNDESDYDSDLDINFITKLEDFDITNDDTDVRTFQLDPSVWATPVKPITPAKIPNVYLKESEIQRKFPIQPPPGLSSPTLAQQQTNALQQFIGATPQNAAPKILSLEEIERNMINQQQIQHKMMQEKLAVIQTKGRKAPNIPNQQPQQPMNGPYPPVPPHFMSGPPPPFSSVPPPHLQAPNMTKFNPLMNITNHPMNMNNFHPNFAGPVHPRAPQQQQQQQLQQNMNRMPPHMIQGAPLMYQQNMQNSAQFNQRLVQEIQQNHPMLNPRPQQQMRGNRDDNMMGGNNRNM